VHQEISPGWRRRRRTNCDVRHTAFLAGSDPSTALLQDFNLATGEFAPPPDWDSHSARTACGPHSESKGSIMISSAIVSSDQLCASDQFISSPSWHSSAERFRCGRMSRQAVVPRAIAKGLSCRRRGGSGPSKGRLPFLFLPPDAAEGRGGQFQQKRWPCLFIS
jgi:hypothetical protein